MDITNHCKRRYAERIKNINNSVEIKEYISLNSDQIEKDINKMFEHAQFIATSQVGGDKTNKNYYISGNVIFVVNTEDTVIITLYKVDFGFPDRTNRAITKDLLEEIAKLNNKLQQENCSISTYADSKKLEIDNWNSQIDCLQEQINCLKRKIRVAEADIDERRKSSNVVNLKLKDYVNKLCNSLAYKMDLKELNK
jgi:hypothetical protein